MSTEKWIARIEAKLDALLEKAGIKPDEVTPAPAPNRAQPRKLSEAEQQAIDNAPAAPSAVPPENAPRTTETGAPSVASSVPAAAKDKK